MGSPSLDSLLVLAIIQGFPLTGPMERGQEGLAHGTVPRNFSEMALEMRTTCEACGAALPAGGTAYICSYECTFCERCAESGARACPNCGGELVRRPRRIHDA